MQNARCSQCRTEIPKFIDDVKIAGCPKCGMVSTLGKDGYLRTNKACTILSANDQEPFLLGEEIQYDGVHYTVFAIYIYLLQYQEWDKEDKRWEHGQGYATEWYAASATNQQLTLMKDTNNVFYIVSQIDDEEFDDWQVQQTTIEFGTYELNSFVGMDDEALDTKGFYRTYPNNIFLESNNESFTQRNFKTFRVKSMTPSEVKRMEIISDTQEEKAVEDFKDTTFYRNVFGIGLLIILCLILLGNTGNNTPIGESKRIAFSYKTFGDTLPDTLALRPQSGGVFDLKAGKNYLFMAQSNVSGTNQDVDFSVSIVRKDDEMTVSEVDIAFYTESGRDDEGSWTENYLSDEFKFQVEKSGKYEIFVSPDYDDITHIPPSSLLVSIHRTGYAYYYLMASGVFLLAFLIFQWQRESIVAYANLPYTTHLHDLTRQ